MYSLYFDAGSWWRVPFASSNTCSVSFFAVRNSVSTKGNVEVKIAGAPSMMILPKSSTAISTMR